VKRSNRLVILVGVLLAVLAFVGIIVVLNQNQPGEQVGPAMETVLVATDDIAIGDPVTPDRVETRQVEADAVVGAPLRDVSQVQGQPALFAIPAGTQVSQASIGLAQGAQNIAGQLLDGERAISFVVDRAQGLDFLLQAGDHVDIIMTTQLLPFLVPDDESIRTVKTMLQNKRVLYVSDTNLEPEVAPTPNPDGTVPPPQAPINNVVIIFAGSDQDAEIIRYAQRTATDIGDGVSSTLSVILRGADDESLQETTGISIEQLLEDYGLPVPGLESITDLLPAPEVTP
jgi:Flp pilus assembly protein CpaB